MQPERFATVAGGVLLTGLIAATAYWAGTSSTDSTETTGPPPAAAPEPEIPASTPAATPEAAGIGWLHASNTRSHRDPGPAAWVDRAAPVLTGPAADEAAAARTGHAGADWDRLVANHCTQRVTDLGSVIPPEAPTTGELVYVQVSGTLVQQCDTGTPSAPQPLSATLETTRSPDGTWRVSQRLY